jgi:hypothetical protein
MYSVLTGQEWSAAAPHFGIPFGSKELCVHIELDEAEARPTQYRERLISKQTGADLVPDVYAMYVAEYMPDWVKDVVKNAFPRRMASNFITPGGAGLAVALTSSSWPGLWRRVSAVV